MQAPPGAWQAARELSETRLQPRNQRVPRHSRRTPDDDLQHLLVGRLDAAIERHPDGRAHVREPEPRRQHADNGVGLVVDPDRPADDVGAAIEQTVPQTVGQDRFGGAGIGERTAQSGRDTEDGKEA